MRGSIVRLQLLKLGTFRSHLDLTCDEDGHAGQGQPGQVSVRLLARWGDVVKLGHHVEVNPERCGADRHHNTFNCY